MTVNLLKPHPLYDELLKRVNNSQNKNIDINSLSMTIKSIWKNSSEEDSNYHYSWIKSLIIHHELLTTNGVMLTSNCYNCKLMPSEKGELYTIVNLPSLLLQIISAYIDYHNS